MKYKDYYEVLGVNKDATQKDISKAYRDLAKQHHPDKNKGNKQSEIKIKEINEAYDVLKNSEKRSKYDDLGKRPQFSGGQDFDPSKYGYKAQRQYQYSGDKAEPYSDFFNMFFSGGGGFDVNDIFNRQRTNTANIVYNGEHIETEIDITPEEGALGIKKNITLQTEKEKRNFTFTIPKGVRDGEKIRLKGQGYPGIGGGQSGDLHLIVRMKASIKFAFKGNDLETNLDIYPWIALLGGKAGVDTLEGRINVNIPKGIQSGSKIRILGKGYPARNRQTGDLFIVIRIVNPKNISSKIQTLYEDLKKLDIQ